MRCATAWPISASASGWSTSRPTMRWRSAMPSSEPRSLREQLAGPDIVVAPGISDALSALIAARAGFGALYLSGASIAYTRYGSPDIGLTGMSEVADTLAAITDRVPVPVIVDG